MLDRPKNQTEKFVDLIKHIKACDTCPRMHNSERVISFANGQPNSSLMFIGEAPGRLGADETGIPFHGDTAGYNFELLIREAGISRYETFITNAVLCNPKDEKQNNSAPKKLEIINCSSHLKAQIELVQPRLVVTLGATALLALSNIENHTLKLKTHVGICTPWFGRKLIPLYHPGQRAMIHRNFDTQKKDYIAVKEQNRILQNLNGSSYTNSKTDIIEVVSEILKNTPEISYFSLHKLAYLIELESVKTNGERLSSAYFIRQKDGPYCTDLHYKKLRRKINGLKFYNKNNKFFIGRKSDLFTQGELIEKENSEIKEIVEKIFSKYGRFSDSELKTAVYLTKPMKKILRKEKTQKIKYFNSQIEFF